MNDNSINELNELLKIKEKRIHNFSELLEYITEYQALRQKYSNAPKQEKILLTEKITSLENQLRKGIKINNEIVLQHIGDVKDFVEFSGFDYSLVEPTLNSIELTISPVNLLEKGKLCNYGSFIAIDYSFANFDEEGNFLGFNEEKPGFFRHAIIHEILHSVSRKGMFIYLDSFSEGMTEYFAHKISKCTNVFSDKYEYIERVFYMFGTMMGDDLLFEDYITDIYSMKNLCAFTSSLGISNEEYKSFKTGLDVFLKKSFEKQQDSEELLTLTSQIDNFIFNRVIMPYCSFDKTKSIEMHDRFFSKSEKTNVELCEFHSHFSENKAKD